MPSRRTFIKQSSMTAAVLLARHASAINSTAEEERFLELRKGITNAATLLKIPGFAAAVVENGKIVYMQTEGFADIDNKIPLRRDHIFPVASLTKTFTAVTLLQLEQEGKISLDDYVLDYPFLSIGFTTERLQNPNVKIKHVLSHTSEGEPGANYMYNGGRYSFVYGAFEKISGDTRHYEAFATELKKRIIEPLQLRSTLTGYPADKNHAAIPRIVSTYKWNKNEQLLKPDKGLPGQTTLFPSAGLLTTIDDLVTYSNALDNNTLLTAAGYQKMTSPFINTSGQQNDYGLGWATQHVDGKKIHWHYGYGDSYAALIIRVPQDKRAFILLTNSVAASEAFYLGYGNILNSVFAQAFFNYVMKGRSEQFDLNKLQQYPPAELFSQAMMRYYTERTYNENAGEGDRILEHLAQHHPHYFQQANLSLLYTLGKLTDPKWKIQTEMAIVAYTNAKLFHPDIHEQVAVWYEKSGNPQSSRQWYHYLADSSYNEQSAVRNACKALGNYYLANGEKEKGRTYLWKAALFSTYAGLGADETTRQIENMKTK